MDRGGAGRSSAASVADDVAFLTTRLRAVLMAAVRACAACRRLGLQRYIGAAAQAARELSMRFQNVSAARVAPDTPAGRTVGAGFRGISGQPLGGVLSYWRTSSFQRYKEVGAPGAWQATAALAPRGSTGPAGNRFAAAPSSRLPRPDPKPARPAEHEPPPMPVKRGELVTGAPARPTPPSARGRLRGLRALNRHDPRAGHGGRPGGDCSVAAGPSRVTAVRRRGACSPPPR